MTGAPVFFRELLAHSRRPRTYVAQTVFLGILVVAMIPFWNASGAQVADTGRMIFEYGGYLQLILLAMLTPAATANAITEEKDTNTLDLLLLTGAGPFSIVLGKFVSRLVVVLYLLVLTLPLLFALLTLGGVSPTIILAQWAILVAFAVLAAGVGREARAEVETACRQAGWRLEGLYPRLACGAAVPADFEDAVVVEVAPDALALTQLREGAVVRAHVLRETSGAMAADRVAAWAGAQPLVVLGALDPDTHAILQASVAELRVVECSLSPSVQGAVRHAFGLAGGERVAAVAGREPAPPLWQRHGVRAAAFVVGWAGLWGAVDVVLERQYQAVRAQHAELDQRSRTRRLQATAVQALTKEREALEGQLAEARAAAELHTQRAQRAGYLVQLLDVLGRAADDGVALRGLEDTLNELTLRGYARSPDEAHTYLHRVELALQPHGLRLTERMVERDPQDPLYTFSATLRRPETP